jgi:hypothetical protein
MAQLSIRIEFASLGAIGPGAAPSSRRSARRSCAGIARSRARRIAQRGRICRALEAATARHKPLPQDRKSQ